MTAEGNEAGVDHPFDPRQTPEEVAGIFATTNYEPARPPARVFFPWHRPRKHFVRETQWSAQIKRVLSHRTDSEPLRYLGLPGTDLLDLRYFHSTHCAEVDRPLRFLGFNTSAASGAAQVEMNLSLDEVRRLSNVDQRSDVRCDDFRQLAERTSIAWKTACDLGPFDVVNLDLCDGLAVDSPVMDGSIYSAIQNLFGLQQRLHLPWLLLITSRVGHGYFDEGALQGLLELYNNNIESCDKFREAIGEHFGDQMLSDLDPAVLEPMDYFAFSVIAVTKWLLALAHRNPSRVEIVSSQGYTVDPASPHLDIVSIAIRITPLLSPPADPAGLAQLDQIQGDECRDAALIPPRVARTIDVDDALASDEGLASHHRDCQRELLSTARYDGAKYDEWLDEQLAAS